MARKISDLSRLLTMPTKFLSSLIFSTLLLTACSIYRSDGRKFLEERAYEYSGASAYAALRSCQPTAEEQGTTLISESTLSRAVRVEGGDTPSLRIIPRSGRPFSCDYGFTNDADLGPLIPEAEALTLQLHL